MISIVSLNYFNTHRRIHYTN